MTDFSSTTTIATFGAGNAGNFSEIVAKVQKAIADGVKADSPMGREIAEYIKKAVPDIAGAPDMVQKIDDMIPDAVQSKFGFTPAVMAFIKEALGAHASKTA